MLYVLGSGMQLTKEEKPDANDGTSKQTGQQMIFKLSESAVHHARETSVLQVDAVDRECNKAGWCDDKKHKAGALAGEVVHDWIHKW